MVQSLYKKNLLKNIKLAYKNVNASKALMSSAYVLNKKGMNLFRFYLITENFF